MSGEPDKSQLHRLIRRYALQAGAVAAASAAIPAPIGAILDAIGIDPVVPIQARMLDELCDMTGLDLTLVRSSLGSRGKFTRRTHPALKSGGAIALRGLGNKLGAKAGRVIGRSANRLLPVAFAVFSGAAAGRETWLLGIRCLELCHPQLRSLSRS